MGLTVTTIAPKTRLTTVALVKSEMGITVSTDDALIGDLVDRASAAIVAYCHRPFAREAYTELLGAYGDIHLQLARTPIAGTPSSVTWNASDEATGAQILTDWSVANRERGWLYRRLGWSWTAQRLGGLVAHGGFLDYGWPLAQQEEPQFSVDYVAGYIMPEQNVTGTTFSAAAADNSFNDSASGFPALLKAGDVIVTSGFATAANNGRFVVSGTPTASKIVVTGVTLANEAASATVTVVVQSLPSDLEKACLDTTKFYYLKRKDDPTVAEKQVNVMRLRFGGVGGGTIFDSNEPLPPSVIGLLRPWVRAA